MVKKQSNPYGNLESLLNEHERVIARYVFQSGDAYTAIKYLGKQLNSKPVMDKQGSLRFIDNKGELHFIPEVGKTFKKRSEILKQMVKQLHPKYRAKNLIGVMNEQDFYNKYMSNAIIDTMSELKQAILNVPEELSIQEFVETNISEGQLNYLETEEVEESYQKAQALADVVQNEILNPFLDETLSALKKGMKPSIKRPTYLNRALELVRENSHLHKRAKELVPLIQRTVELYISYLSDQHPFEVRQDLEKDRQELADKSNSLRVMADVYSGGYSEPQRVRRDMISLAENIILLQQSLEGDKQYNGHILNTSQLINGLKVSYSEFSKQGESKTKLKTPKKLHDLVGRVINAETFWDTVFDESKFTHLWHSRTMQALEMYKEVKDNIIKGYAFGFNLDNWIATPYIDKTGKFLSQNTIIYKTDVAEKIQHNLIKDFTNFLNANSDDVYGIEWEDDKLRAIVSVVSSKQYIISAQKEGVRIDAALGDAELLRKYSDILYVEPVIRRMFPELTDIATENNNLPHFNV